jgi:hypothetical protein
MYSKMYSEGRVYGKKKPPTNRILFQKSVFDFWDGTDFQTDFPMQQHDTYSYRHFIHLLEPLPTMDGDFNADSELLVDLEDAVVAQVVISNNTAMAMLQEEGNVVPAVNRESNTTINQCH